MNVYRDLKDLPTFERTVITIGSFDGLHAGHQKILRQLKQIANTNSIESVVITFDPHPRHIIYPKDDSLRLLTTLDEKVELFRKSGVDNLVLVPFTVEFSQMPAEEYVQNFLIEYFKPSFIVIGYDHRFGLNRAGNIDLLKMRSTTLDYEVVEIPKQEIDSLGISSTKVRRALAEGSLDIVNTLLDRPYHLSGIVIRGRKLGTEIGFPTANLRLLSKYKLVPKLGIYVVHVVVRDKRYKGMLYIGDLPTVGIEGGRSIEVNIFDFEEDIYDELIEVHLLKFLREDEKFESIEALRSQLFVDKKDSQDYFLNENISEDLNTTIAVLNYNTVSHLENFMPSLSFSSEKDFDLVVIDNDSSDGSQAFLAEWHPEVEIVQLNENHGFAGGYNLGLKNIDSKYIALVNSDIRVDKNWLDPLIDFLETNSDYAAVMPKVRSLMEPENFEYAGASGGFMDKLGYPFCRGRIFDSLEKDEAQYDEPVDVFWVTGAAFVIRRELYEKFGGFDEDYFAHQEEIDLCWRLANAGYKMAVIPSSVVYHLGGGTLDYGNTRKVFLNFRNNLSSIVKNGSLSELLFLIPFRLALDGVAGVKFLLSGKPASCWAIIKAHFSFYGQYFSLLNKRKEIHRTRSENSIGIPSQAGRISKSIIFQYYIRGKKTFAEIINS